MTRLFNVACLVLALFLMPSLSHATPVTVGAGPQTVGSNDSAIPLLVIQTGSPQTLQAGHFAASLFNYQFTTADSSTTLQGTVEPFLAIDNGTGGYTPIALGNGVTYTGDTAFVSALFGGSNSFNLATATPVYAGFYWDPTTSGVRSPIGFFSGSGAVDSFLHYNGGTNAPVVGVDVSGGTTGSFPRAYDFSITVVPEPSSIVLIGCACGLFGLNLLRHKRKANQVVQS